MFLYSYFKYKQGSSTVNHPLLMVSAHKKSKLKERKLGKCFILKHHCSFAFVISQHSCKLTNSFSTFMRLSGGCQCFTSKCI